ncbi:MAG: RcnB family protein [bacterium]|nr:RcnB family protein [bacterium]
MFKKILTALAVTTMVASPLVTAQAQAQSHNVPQHRQETSRTVVTHKANGRTVVKKQIVRKDNHRRWAKGQRFDRRYANNYQVVNNYRGYRLNAPPRGYHWVRSGNDAVLVGITSGIISAVVAGAIR